MRPLPCRQTTSAGRRSAKAARATARLRPPVNHCSLGTDRQNSTIGCDSKGAPAGPRVGWRRDLTYLHEAAMHCVPFVHPWDARDRKSVVTGQSVAVRVDQGGVRILKTQNQK